jgi:hypothetical protein
MMNPKLAGFHSLSAFRMKPLLRSSRSSLALLFLLPALFVCGQTMPPGATTPQRDGSHDFDFNVGVWHTHIRRVMDPFDPSSPSIVLDGTVTVRTVWGGRAQLEEIEADGSKGHWEGMSLFLYDPAAHQWSQTFLNSKTPVFGTPLIGTFHDGRADLFGEDTYKNQTILVRGVWSQVEPNSHRYEESYSNDGGQTWKFSFRADLNRDEQVKDQNGTALADPPADDSPTAEQHQFDFDLGTWHTHSKRLLHPLSGSGDWVEMDGTTVVRRVWGGKANLAVYDAKGAGGKVTLLGLRWFNPVMHEWNIDFATPQVGTLGSIPGVGKFNDGRAVFYDYEPIGGRSVLVRFSIWKITADTAQSEQAFSMDGGKTWEVNWINHYTRVKGE